MIFVFAVCPLWCKFGDGLFRVHSSRRRHANSCLEVNTQTLVYQLDFVICSTLLRVYSVLLISRYEVSFCFFLFNQYILKYATSIDASHFELNRI